MTWRLPLKSPVPIQISASAPMMAITAGVPVAQGEGQQKVAQEHDRDADRHHATVTEFIGENTSDKGEEINEHQECGIVRPGESGTPSEVVLEEQHENGQHGVVAETLTGVGESEGE